jgi:signal transduction histidine kinase
MRRRRRILLFALSPLLVYMLVIAAFVFAASMED